MRKEENNNVSTDISDLKKSMLEIQNKINELAKKYNNAKIECDDTVNICNGEHVDNISISSSIGIDIGICETDKGSLIILDANNNIIKIISV